MKKILYIILFFLVGLLFSCENKNSCFHSYGDEKSLIIEVTNFNELNIEGGYNINLIKSTEFKIEAIGGANNLEFVNVELFDNVLTIKNDNQCNWLRDYDNQVLLNIYFKDLKVITNSSESYIFNKTPLVLDTLFIHQTGVGDFDLKFESANYLWTDMYVFGDVEISGNIDEFHCKVASYGNLRAKELRANVMYIEASHEGDAHVYPTLFIKAICSKIGNIFYYNDAKEIVVEQTGKGKYLKGI